MVFNEAILCSELIFLTVVTRPKQFGFPFHNVLYIASYISILIILKFNMYSVIRFSTSGCNYHIIYYI